MRTQAILRLDATGAVASRIEAPDALFLNGMTTLDDGTVLIADSIAGTIWALDPGSEALRPWLSDPALTQPADMVAFQPGANGLKVAEGWLYVSNSARGTLHRAPLLTDGGPGALELVAQTGGIDDFWIEPDGAAVFATHADTLARLDADGARTVLLADGCDGCTAVAPRGGDWIVLTTGGLLEGANEPARVLALPR